MNRKKQVIKIYTDFISVSATPKKVRKNIKINQSSVCQTSTKEGFRSMFKTSLQDINFCNALYGTPFHIAYHFMLLPQILKAF